MIKKIGNWGGSRSLRLESELKQIGLNEGDMVTTTIVDDKIIVKRAFTAEKNSNL